MLLLDNFQTVPVSLGLQEVVAIDKLDVLACGILQSGVAGDRQSLIALADIYDVGQQRTEMFNRRTVGTVVDKYYLALLGRNVDCQDAFQTRSQHVVGQIVGRDQKADELFSRFICKIHRCKNNKNF